MTESCACVCVCGSAKLRGFKGLGENRQTSTKGARKQTTTLVSDCSWPDKQLRIPRINCSTLLVLGSFILHGPCLKWQLRGGSNLSASCKARLPPQSGQLRIRITASSAVFALRLLNIAPWHWKLTLRIHFSYYAFAPDHAPAPLLQKICADPGAMQTFRGLEYVKAILQDLCGHPGPGQH